MEGVRFNSSIGCYFFIMKPGDLIRLKEKKDVGIILEINYNGLYKVQFFNNLSKRYWVVEKYLELVSEKR